MRDNPTKTKSFRTLTSPTQLLMHVRSFKLLAIEPGAKPQVTHTFNSA